MSHTDLAAPLFEFHAGQGTRQFAELAMALLLSSLIGLEREVRQKSAGLRTHTLVGVGSALFMEVSVHGFSALLGTDGATLDPSRVAAQIVSGIGFIGGGLIFVKKDAVRGLTTAATVWLTCAIGMACGGGLILLAIGATAVHFLVVRGFPKVTERLLSSVSPERVELRLAHHRQPGFLGQALELCTRRGFQVTDVRVEADTHDRDQTDDRTTSEILLCLEGRAPANTLLEELAEMDGVRRVTLVRHTDSTE
ncbi:MgtC/SapB family protein [Streptomyces sp. NPDC003077]|uniref:MgtC/SapB family protein n=1 Tax=Streptomyces sp. NPDC003077 TaxID=3154443 RepID=UPI00339F8419